MSHSPQGPPLHSVEATADAGDTVEAIDDGGETTGVNNAGDAECDPTAEQADVQVGTSGQVRVDAANVGLGVSKLMARAAAAKEVTAKQLAVPVADGGGSGLGAMMTINRARERFAARGRNNQGRHRDEHENSVEEIDDDGGMD